MFLLREMHHMPQWVLPLVSNKHPKVGIQFDNILLSYAVQGFNESNAHLITLNSNGQGLHYLTADNNMNAYHVGIDTNNNIQVEPESEFDTVR